MNVRGRMAMARGRDHFSVGLRKKNRERKREKKLNGEEKSSSRCVKTTVARESRIDFDVTLR